MEDETPIRTFINNLRNINVKKPYLYSVLPRYEELNIFSNFLKGYILNWNKYSTFEDCLSKITRNYKDTDILELHDLILFNYTEEYFNIMNINGEYIQKIDKIKKFKNKINIDNTSLVIDYFKNC